MATNPLGPNKTTITIYLDTSVYLEATSLADTCGIKASEYARAILEDAVKRKVMVRKNPDDVRAFRDALLAQQPKPKVRLEVIDLKKTISLPANVFDEAAAKARQMGFTTFSEYIQHLTEKDLKARVDYHEPDEVETPPHDAATTNLRAAESHKRPRAKR